MDGLSAAERSPLLSAVHVVPVAVREPAAAIGQPFEHLVFPIDCIMSVVVLFETGAATEVGTVGREGFVPTEVVAGARRAHRSTFCRVPGRAAVMHRDIFDRAMERPEFASLVRRNASSRLFTSEQLTACNANHDVLRRCARWLLMTRDRVGRDDFYLTHEFLAMMLGVRRAGVTQAAGELARMGAIRYQRGNVTITDGDRLVAAACECYPVIARSFEGALSPAAVPRSLHRNDGRTA